MIVIKDSVYVRSKEGYARCTLHKKKHNGRDLYSLEATKATIKDLPRDYAVMTLPEVIAKYGATAIDDDTP